MTNRIYGIAVDMSVKGDDCFTLMCEMSYIFNEKIGDATKTRSWLPGVVLRSRLNLGRIKKIIYQYWQKISPHADPNTRLYRSMDHAMKDFKNSYLVETIYAVLTAGFGKMATVAQKFDLLVVKPFSELVEFSMVRRVMIEAMAHTSNKKVFMEDPVNRP